MNTPICRYNTTSGGQFKPAALRKCTPIAIADDNLVCVHCGIPLGEVEWTIVSSGQRKGLVAFACKEHASQAINVLARAFGDKPVSDEVKLPDVNEN